MVNVNEYLEDVANGVETDLCPDCQQKLGTVLDSLDEITEELGLDDEEKEIIIDTLDNLYEQVYAVAYREGVRDIVKQNIIMNSDFLDELDDLDEEEEHE